MDDEFGDVFDTFGDNDENMFDPNELEGDVAAPATAGMTNLFGETLPSDAGYGTVPSGIDAAQSQEGGLQRPHIASIFPNADPEMEPTVVGVVAFMDHGVGIDLRSLACGCRNVEYTPKRAPSATLRLRDPACVVLVRNSGSASIVGAASISAAKQAATVVARIVRRVTDVPIRKIRFRVSSLMCRWDLRHPVSLEKLHSENRSMASYEPESFCGCILKLGDPEGAWRVSVSVFVSGKCTMTGARNMSEANQAFNMALPLIAPCAKVTPKSDDAAQA